MDILDLAKKLHVSVATVSRALNPATSKMVADKTRKRITEYADRVGYYPNRSARALSSGRTHVIGLVLPNVLESIFFNDYFIKVLAGVYHVMDQEPRYSCKIIILPKGKVLTNLDRELLAGGLDGVLLSPYCDPVLYGADFPKTLLKQWNKPVVVLNGNSSHVGRFNSVFTDHRDAAKKAVTYLIQKGHKQIAMIQGDHFFPEVAHRYEGYCEALASHGMPLNQNLIEKGRFLVEGGYEATLRLLKGTGRKITAIFCANDEMAMGSLRALSTLGVNCPSDIAVMGFDGLDLGEYLAPKLSTVVQPTREIAEAGTSLMLDLVRNEPTKLVAHLVPSRLLIRESA